jgi:glutaredoxin
VPESPVLLYVIPGCAHCAAKRAELAARGASVREIDVRARPEVVPELLKLTAGRRVVPVVVDAAGVHVAPDGGSAF